MMLCESSGSGFAGTSCEPAYFGPWKTYIGLLRAERSGLGSIAREPPVNIW